MDGGGCARPHRGCWRSRPRTRGNDGRAGEADVPDGSKFAEEIEQVFGRDVVGEVLDEEGAVARISQRARTEVRRVGDMRLTGSLVGRPWNYDS